MLRVCVVCVKCVQKEAKVLTDTRTWNSHKAIVEYTQIYIIRKVLSRISFRLLTCPTSDFRQVIIPEVAT